MIPEIIRKQDPPTAQTPRQDNNQRNRTRRLNAEIRDMGALFPDIDDDVLSEISISDDDDDDDDLDNPRGPDRRQSGIINRPEQGIRLGRPNLIRPAKGLRPGIIHFPTIIKQEPANQSVVHVIDEGIDNLLDRQMTRARQRLQQQKKSSIQKKRSLNADSEGFSKKKRGAIPLRGNNVKDSKPGFQV